MKKGDITSVNKEKGTVIVFCPVSHGPSESNYLKGVGKNVCKHCNLERTKEGHDGCLGTLPNVMNACCGHGSDKDAYIQFNHKDYKNKPNKIRLSGKEAIEKFKEIKENQQFFRAHKDTICKKCGKKYILHQEDKKDNWLNVLCNGIRVKL